jgi:hypothetical protein
MSKIDFSQRLLDDLIAVALLDKAEGVIKLPDWQRVLRGEVVAAGPGRMLEYRRARSDGVQDRRHRLVLGHGRHGQ